VSIATTGTTSLAPNIPEKHVKMHMQYARVTQSLSERMQGEMAVLMDCVKECERERMQAEIDKKVSTGLADLLARISNEVSDSVKAKIEDFATEYAIGSEEDTAVRPRR
jgi:gas vesicle protein